MLALKHEAVKYFYEFNGTPFNPTGTGLEMVLSSCSSRKEIINYSSLQQTQKMKQCLSAYFKGKVQGMGFRYTVCHLARGMAVTGYVKNLSDGRVEVMAEGEGLELEKLLREINHSNLGKYIRETKIEWFECRNRFSNFKIAY